jgi:hypothetical protein
MLFHHLFICVLVSYTRDSAALDNRRNIMSTTVETLWVPQWKHYEYHSGNIMRTTVETLWVPRWKHYAYHSGNIMSTTVETLWVPQWKHYEYHSGNIMSTTMETLWVPQWYLQVVWLCKVALTAFKVETLNSSKFMLLPLVGLFLGFTKQYENATKARIPTNFIASISSHNSTCTWHVKKGLWGTTHILQGSSSSVAHAK